jgi:hypothetical protein
MIGQAVSEIQRFQCFVALWLAAILDFLQTGSGSIFWGVSSDGRKLLLKFHDDRSTGL